MLPETRVTGRPNLDGFGAVVGNRESFYSEPCEEYNFGNNIKIEELGRVAGELCPWLSRVQVVPIGWVQSAWRSWRRLGCGGWGLGEMAPAIVDTCGARGTKLRKENLLTKGLPKC